MRLEHARLTIRDVEDLTDCLNRLNEVHDSVNATGMSGKVAIMGACVQVYRVIERLLRKEQHVVQLWRANLERNGATANGPEET
jgi:hypothetical protein